MTYQTSSVELDMVNDVLYNTGESFVNSLEGGADVAQIRAALEREKKRLLYNEGFGWSWNVTDLSLTTDINGEVRINENVLGLISEYPTYRVIDGVLRDMKENTTKNLHTTDIQGIINLEYKYLPVNAQQYLSFWVSYREAISQEMSQSVKDTLLQNAVQLLNELQTQEINNIQSDGSYTALGRTNVYNPVTIYQNLGKV